MIEKRANKAFSLIEMSIVVVVIGILIAAVSISSRLVNSSRISLARTQTQSSPVQGIKGLNLWLDTVSLASFDNEPENNDQIQNWLDISPQNTIKFIARQNTQIKRPTYKTNVFNGLPALVFDGNDDDMVINNLDAGSNTSYFFVVQPATAQVEGIFDSAPNKLWVFRNLCDQPDYPTCEGDGAFSWWNGSNPTPQTKLGLAADGKYILFAETKLDPNKVLTYYRNGELISSATDESNEDTAWANPRIGSINLNLKFYNGSIGEIIIYNRLLTKEEREAVTRYLSRKWSIRL